MKTIHLRQILKIKQDSSGYTSNMLHVVISQLFSINLKNTPIDLSKAISSSLRVLNFNLLFLKLNHFILNPNQSNPIVGTPQPKEVK